MSQARLEGYQYGSSLNKKKNVISVADKSDKIDKLVGQLKLL